MALALLWLLVLVLVFEIVDSTLGRFNGNSEEFCSEEHSKSGRFVGLGGVTGGDDESMEGGDEGHCSCFFRLREMYVRWALEDIKY